jgi:hypothetical protein
MNIQDIANFANKQNIEFGKIIVVKQDDSRKLLLVTKQIIRQLVQQSVEEDGIGKLYILDNLSSEWLKNDNINLPIKFSTALN